MATSTFKNITPQTVKTQPIKTVGGKKTTTSSPKSGNGMKVVTLRGKKDDSVYESFKNRFEIVGDIMSPIDEKWDAEK